MTKAEQYPGVIYAVINQVNGMLYIGQATDWERRKRQYLRNEHRGQTKLYNATRAYGWKNFLFEIIQDNIAEDELNERERHWIDYCHTFDEYDPSFGYNLTSGGDRPIFSQETRGKMSKSRSGEKNPMFGKHHSEKAKTKNAEAHIGKKLTTETKKKMSKARMGNKNVLGRKLSNETKAKISKSVSGEKHYLFGKHLSNEIKEKLSKANDKNKIPIMCNETGIVYESACDAARKLEIHQGNISKCIRGMRKKTGGYTFSIYQKDSSVK